MTALELVQNVMDSMTWGDVSTIESSTNKQVLRSIRAINNVLKSMQSDTNWPELREAAHIYLTGGTEPTASITAAYGSDEVTVTMAAHEGYVGYRIQFDGDHKGIYTISDSDDDPADIWVLDRVYGGESASGLGCILFKDTYSFPADFDRLVSGDMINEETGTQVLEVDPLRMRKIKRDIGIEIELQEPQNFTVFGEDSSGNKVLYTDYAAEDSHTLQYEYQKHHPEIGSDDDQDILYPERVMLALQDAVIARLNRDAENSQVMQVAASDALRERARADANPSTGAEQMLMYPRRVMRGWTRRR